MDIAEESEHLRTKCRSVFAPTVLQASPELIDSRVLTTSLEPFGIIVRRIDYQKVLSEDELFDSIAKSCGFPSYFGRNHAALKDCLLDFSWLNPKPSGIVLLYRWPELLDWTAMGEFIIVADEVRTIYGQNRKFFKVVMAERRPG